MKKILAILCAILIFALPVVAFAEGEPADDIVQGEVEDTTEEEAPTEGEILPPETMPEETPEEVPEEIPEETPPVEEPPVETPPVETPKEEAPTLKEEVQIEVEILTENIKKWFEENSAFIGLIVTIIGYGIVMIKKLGTVVKSTGTINNNAITIAKTSNDAVSQALSSIENASGIVTGYDTRIVALLEAYKNTAEDKAMLERELVEIKSYLKTSTEANVEFANELAELLGLANIPNCKKEEIGARHLAAVRAIIAAEEKAEVEAENAAKMLLPATTEEVKNDVGEEKKD